jgi:hypothetical protein
MSKQKDKIKLEKFVTAWENDVGKMEATITSFKGEIQPTIQQIQDNIHDMRKYDSSSIGGQLEKTRRLQKLMLDKLETLEKLQAHRMSTEN